MKEEINNKMMNGQFTDDRWSNPTSPNRIVNKGFDFWSPPKDATAKIRFLDPTPGMHAFYHYIEEDSKPIVCPVCEALDALKNKPSIWDRADLALKDIGEDIKEINPLGWGIWILATWMPAIFICLMIFLTDWMKERKREAE